MKATRSGFSMIELVFVIVILGVLAAVAVPRFAATRTDAQMVTAKSDAATVLNAIPAKVMADNIDTSMTSAPNPSKSASQAIQDNDTMTWGKWIAEVAGLDGSRWKVEAGAINKGVNVQNSNSVAPIGTVSGKKTPCGAMIGIDTNAESLVFSPNNLTNNVSSSGGNNFCERLAASYQSSQGQGNRIILLGSKSTADL